jgi:mRNA interferase MazF
VWLNFDPRAGHEQAGHRPALVLSPESYNRKVGLALFCPITTQRKGYPFEVVLPTGLEVSGVILSDQVKSLDWKARETRFGCLLPPETLQEVAAKLSSLLEA